MSKDVCMDASVLHNMYYEYMLDVHRIAVRKDDCVFTDLFKSNEEGKQGPYANVVHKYMFNTTDLWMILVKKKWVKEAANYYAKQNEKLIKDFLVDRRFTAMSELMDITEIEERAKVNPGKLRF